MRVSCLAMFLGAVMLVTGKPCDRYNLEREFSECDPIKNTRTAYYYWVKPCSGGDPLRPPVHNLNCKVECRPGLYLDLDDTLQKSTCMTCPDGTFSVGGGSRWRGEDWSNLEFFTNRCLTHERHKWNEGVNCSPWSYTNGYLVSGQSTQTGVAVESELGITADLVKPGYLRIRYKNQTITRENNRQSNGSFVVFVDDELLIYNVDPSKNDWQVEEIDLDIGRHDILIIYGKIVDEGTEAETIVAVIDELQLVGMEYADHKCVSCENASHEFAEWQCTRCQPGQYFDETECQQCPEGTYSERHAMYLESCFDLPKCTKDHITETFTECVKGTRSKISAWLDPLLCYEEDQRGLNKEDGLPCADCNRGRINAPTCEPCPAGTATFSDPDTCTECPAGTFAEKVLNYTYWHPFPEEFSNTCTHMNGSPCLQPEGWINLGTHLSAGAHLWGSEEDVKPNQRWLDKMPSANLELEVNITSRNGTVSYELDIEGNTLMMFIIDGIVAVIHEDEDLVVEESFVLEQGTHMLQWETNNMARLRWIAIVGSDRGAAASCTRCPDGHISAAGVDACTPCPSGTEPNAAQTDCVACPHGTFTDLPATQRCMACPRNTYSAADGTFCYGQPHVKFSGSSEYHIGSLIGEVEGASKAAYSICSNPTVELYCQGPFYGHLSDEEDDLFLSILNPSRLDMNYASYNTTAEATRLGYAFALMSGENLPTHAPPTSATTGQRNPCFKQEDRYIVNLGSRIGDFAYLDTMLAVTYVDGDLCNERTGETFSTRVNLICDEEENSGWPTLVEAWFCKYTFQWKTKYACPVCEEKDVKKIEGSCDDGKRSVRYFPDKACVLTGSQLYEYEEDCSEVEDLIHMWQVVVGILLLLLIAILAIVSMIICCKTKQKYDLLLESHGD